MDRIPNTANFLIYDLELVNLLVITILNTAIIFKLGSQF